MSGTSIAAKSLWKNTLVYAAEPKNADDAYRSFKSKERMPSVNPKTMADGLLTALSERTFAIMLKNVDDVLVVKEQSIMKAMKLVFQYLKIVIEPSSAVPLAAVIDYPEVFNGKKVAIILSGGNVDLPNLPF
jgi:threonine dehydratase